MYLYQLKNGFNFGWVKETIAIFDVHAYSILILEISHVKLILYEKHCQQKKNNIKYKIPDNLSIMFSLSSSATD